MLKKILSISIFCAVCLALLSVPLFAQTAANANICTTQQCVKLQNGYLWVLSSDNSSYVPYFVKSVGYQPTPIGRYPSDWGYASTDPRSANNNIYDDPNILNRDFTLLQQMNANTIRIWQGNDIKVSCNCTNNGRDTSYMTNAGNTLNTDTTQNTLDIAASYGLKVIAGFKINPLTFDANNNIGSTDANGNSLTRQQIINNFVSFVNTFKGNRAVLMWAIGNENNYQQFTESPVYLLTFQAILGNTIGAEIFNWLDQTANYVDDDGNVIVNPNTSSVQNAIQSEMNAIGDNSSSDYNFVVNSLVSSYGASLTSQQLTAWYSLVDAMAQAAHAAEGTNFHPVTVVNGGIAEIGNSADGATDAQMPDLDIWGVNEYLGQSFGNLFTTYAAKSSKPLWVSEFGVDAWNVTSATGINDWGQTLSSDLGGTGVSDPTDQSNWDGSLWNEILNNAPVTIGGSVMEYSDEWWKPNEFYCSSPYNNQNANTISNGVCNSNQKYFGFPDGPATPDGFSNEEWYGIVSISPNPTVGAPDIVTPRAVYNNLQTLWQSNPWPTLTLNVTGSGAGNISSPASFGAGLNCNYSSSASTGNCSAGLVKNQPVTLSFSSNTGSTVTNWGTGGCASGSSTCTVTLSSALNLNVTVTSLPTVSLGLYVYSHMAPASVFLSASASETGGIISKVEFYSGSTLIGTSTTANYGDFNFVWSNIPLGNYSITAKAYDSYNNTVISSPVTFSIGAGLPTATLTAVSPSASAPATVTLTATASSNNGTISRVSFYNGSALLGTVTSSPYTLTLNNVPAGTYTYTVLATDSTGATSNPVVAAILIYPHIAPTVSLTSPVNNTSYTLPSSISLTANAGATNATISNVAFYSGTTLLATASSSPYAYTWNNPAAGTYSLTAVATDSTGAQSTSSPVSITVNPISNGNLTPTVSLGLYIYSNTEPGSVFLSASAIETGGTISKVEFYNGTTLIGTITTPFYGDFDYVWNSIAPGNYSVTAKAYDASNNTAVSTPVTFSIGGTSLSLALPSNSSPAGSGVSSNTSSDASSPSSFTTNSYLAQLSGTLPEISTNPVSQTVAATQTATFVVNASGSPTPTYQWQSSPNGGTFANISGATSATYTTPAAAISDNGTQFQCVVTNTAGSATSEPATLTVTK